MPYNTSLYWLLLDTNKVHFTIPAGGHGGQYRGVWLHCDAHRNYYPFYNTYHIGMNMKQIINNISGPEIHIISWVYWLCIVLTNSLIEIGTIRFHTNPL